MPFQDQNPHFFGKVSLSWIVLKSISKTYSFNFCLDQTTQEKNLGQNLDFWKSYFQFLRWNWVFGTNMESNAAVTLNLEDLASKIPCFKKNCAFVGEKSQIVYIGTFDDCEVFLFKFFEDQV